MLGWLLITAMAHADPLPPISAETLSGRVVDLPASMPAERTILLLGFKQSHQAEFDAWRTQLPSLVGEDVDWLELPFVHVPGFLRGIIGSAMNRSLKDPVVRAHFAPVWADPGPVLQAFDITTDDEMVLVVVDATGSLLFRVDGAPTDERRADLTAALSEAGERTRAP
jgi:hypothetical protein